jgi:hypothetical protein
MSLNNRFCLKKLQIALLLCCVGLISCVTTSKIKMETDSLTGSPIYKTDVLKVVNFTTGVDRNGKKETKQSSVGFDLQFIKKKNGDKSEYEVIVFDGGEFARPISVIKTDSLQFMVDGTLFQYSTEIDAKSSEFTSPGVIGQIVMHTLVYKSIPESLIQSLVSSKDMKVRIKSVTVEKAGFLEPIAKDALRNILDSK